MYGEIFSGVTLVATTGAGLPNLAARGFTVPSDFTAACPHPNMDCAAEMTILSYFGKPTVGGANAKAAQEDGMEAARVSLGRFNLGVDGIKLVSRSTAQYRVRVNCHRSALIWAMIGISTYARVIVALQGVAAG